MSLSKNSGPLLFQLRTPFIQTYLRARWLLLGILVSSGTWKARHHRRPKEARKKALVARDHFDELYLIVDQQRRWKSALLPDPRPRALDPLLIGEHNEGHRRKFFVIDQFDLTEVEQYLTNEFAAKQV